MAAGECMRSTARIEVCGYGSRKIGKPLILVATRVDIMYL